MQHQKIHGDTRQITYRSYNTMIQNMLKKDNRRTVETWTTVEWQKGREQ